MNRLSQLRRMAALTQSDLAYRASRRQLVITAFDVSDAELGKAIDSKKLSALATYLGVGASYARTLYEEVSDPLEEARKAARARTEQAFAQEQALRSADAAAAQEDIPAPPSLNARVLASRGR